MKYFALPTWLIAKLTIPYTPANHPWHNRKFSLDDWNKGRTIFSKQLDILIWFYIIFIIAICL